MIDAETARAIAAAAGRIAGAISGVAAAITALTLVTCFGG
jgi:hypothetical protein